MSGKPKNKNVYSHLFTAEMRARRAAWNRKNWMKKKAKS